jgi:hypothetical protein
MGTMAQGPRTPKLLLAAAAAALAIAGCGGSSSSGTEPTPTTRNGGPENKAKPPGPGGTGPTTGAQEIDPELRQAIAEAAGSGIPVRIPTELLADPPQRAERAEVLRSPSDSYTLGLSKQPGCKLKAECTAAIFSGFSGPGQLTGRKLALAHGIEGVYEPGRCGPGCQFGTVEWQQEGNRYGVSVAKTPLGKLKALANSAISSPPLGG